MEAQSVLFDRARFDAKSARARLRKHKIEPIKPVDVTANRLRYRVHHPGGYAVLRTIAITDGIQFVVGRKRAQSRSRSRSRPRARPRTRKRSQSRAKTRGSM